LSWGFTGMDGDDPDGSGEAEELKLQRWG